MFRNILVAVDRGTDALTLLDEATALARMTGARLVVVHAVCVSGPELPRDVSGLIEALEALDVRAHAEVAELTKRVARAGVEVSAVVWHGEPDRVLRDAIRSEAPDLVVLGSRSGVPGRLEALVGDCPMLRIPLRAEAGG